MTDAMFRQVRSAETIPFNGYRLGDRLSVPSVDYDMGRQGVAYFDRDSASYHYTPGVKTTGNRGYAYRNDGVDIRRDIKGYYVFSIENGEWLQYTIEVEKKAKYTVSFIVSAASDTGRLSLFSNNVLLVNGLQVPGSGAMNIRQPVARPPDREEKDVEEPLNWQTISVQHVSLENGSNKLKVMADKGGFNFVSIQFSRE
ncbi:carbohydrate-binding protein [Flavitalea flava]